MGQPTQNSMELNVPVRLVYSYSHQDSECLTSMKTALAPLRDQGVLQEWLDEDIPPGQPISSSVKEKLRNADIIVFLLSSRFIASPACMEEWDYAKALNADAATMHRVPVLLAPCPWEELLDDEDIKLLPSEANPISEHQDPDRGWLQVYQGIKHLIEHIRRTFTPKPDFLAAMEETELLSHEGIQLSDLFILPPLTSYVTQPGAKGLLERRIPNESQLLTLGHTLIHGAEMSGKTALARHLFLSLSQQDKGVLFVDIKASHGAPNERTFKTLYENQFSGDYDLWRRTPGKTAIVDNVDSAPRVRKFIASLKERFDRVIVFVNTDTFIAYYRDDRTFANFTEVRLGQLSYVQQEQLIRTRLTLTARSSAAVTDGAVDQVEQQVNNVIHRRIVPRYPFYVLSIVQTFEGYMPSNLAITSYGHCYHALIVAKLIKAGVDRSDEDLNACFNFAEHLAFALYESGIDDQTETDDFEFDAFIRQYGETYIIRPSLLNRLRDREYGILSANGLFKIPYMHYYFLGKHLAASSGDKERAAVDEMCQKSYVRSNHLTLLFVIHHATDNRVIDAIVRIASSTLQEVQPASLGTDETRRFNEIIHGLPKTVLNDGDVEGERHREREALDQADSGEGVEEASHEVEGDEDSIEQVNDWYRMFKNNAILGQVLRSRYGRLTKEEIESIIETISEGGLRLVNYILKDEREIEELAKFVTERYASEYNYKQIVRLVQLLSFVWTMANVEAIVSCVNGANIKEVLDAVVKRHKTPAYDLIGYFSRLDSARELNDDIKKNLRSLLRQHDDPFVKSVVSLRTQHYMNTHRSDNAIEQSFCSLLGIPRRRFLLQQDRASRRQNRRGKR